MTYIIGSKITSVSLTCILICIGSINKVIGRGVGKIKSITKDTIPIGIGQTSIRDIKTTITLSLMTQPKLAPTLLSTLWEPQSALHESHFQHRF